GGEQKQRGTEPRTLDDPTGELEMRTKFGPFYVFLTIAVLGQTAMGLPARADTTTRSSSIALNKAGSLLFNVNADANTVTVFEVGKNGGNLTKADEVAVGRDPASVALPGPTA